MIPVFTIDPKVVLEKHIKKPNVYISLEVSTKTEKTTTMVNSIVRLINFHTKRVQSINLHACMHNIWRSLVASNNMDTSTEDRAGKLDKFLMPFHHVNPAMWYTEK